LRAVPVSRDVSACAGAAVSPELGPMGGALVSEPSVLSAVAAGGSKASAGRS